MSILQKKQWPSLPTFIQLSVSFQNCESEDKTAKLSAKPTPTLPTHFLGRTSTLYHIVLPSSYKDY